MTQFLKQRWVMLMAKVDDEHPYAVSFAMSLTLISFMLFYTSGADLETDAPSVESLAFVDLKDIQAPKRVVAKQVTADANASDQNQVTEKAEGSSDSDPTDLSFYPDIVPPHQLGKIKKFYPKEAEQYNVQANVDVEIVISAKGYVTKVIVQYISLDKKLPGAIEKSLKAKFAKDTVKSLMGLQFSKPIVNGKNLPIIRGFQISFKL